MRINRLTALEVARAKPPALLADGAGLYLLVTGSREPPAKSWIFKYSVPGSGKVRDMGLGSLHTYTLAEARKLARQARQLVQQGIDPIDQRKASRQRAVLERIVAAARKKRHAQQRGAGGIMPKRAAIFDALLFLKDQRVLVPRGLLYAVTGDWMMAALDRRERDQRAYGDIPAMLVNGSRRSYEIPSQPKRQRVRLVSDT
jgi:hypothetical protein